MRKRMILYTLWVIYLALPAICGSTCESSCGRQSATGSCWCDALCVAREDCCADMSQFCKLCKNNCRGKRVWQPQLGSVEYPKLPGQWSFARAGDVIKVWRKLYVADSTVNLTQSKSQIRQSDVRRLRQGTFRNPFDYNTDLVYRRKSIFFDDINDSYYISTCAGPKATCLSELNVEENWMWLLRSDIGNKRLGDLALPGSHDAGARLGGCTTSSYLINNNPTLALIWSNTPEVVVDWAVTQEHDILTQLESGWRYFDLRIADTFEMFNDTFFWWHSITCDPIFEGLEQIATFAASHRSEVIILDFTRTPSFAAPTVDSWTTMTNDRLDVVTDILLEYLGNVLVNATELCSINPTLNEILSTGRNVLALVRNEYVRQKSDLFWDAPITRDFEARENPEDLFNERSTQLQGFSATNRNNITEISLTVTSSTRMQAALLSKLVESNPLYEWDDMQDVILDAIDFPLALPLTVKMNHTRMSFEGLWTDLLTMARFGANTNGMLVRDASRYSSGASVHYRGTNRMIRHWLARPEKYKPTVYYVDDTTVSSTAVQTCIDANIGNLKREVAIVYQGTPTHGYYFWTFEMSIFTGDIYIFLANGGDDAYECSTIKVAVDISTAEHNTNRRVEFSSPFEMIFKEGDYPEDTIVTVFVASQNSNWHELYSNKIQDMITVNEDIYIRGTDINGTSGFAYVSENYALYRGGIPSCSVPAVSGFNHEITWAETGSSEGLNWD